MTTPERAVEKALENESFIEQKRRKRQEEEEKQEAATLLKEAEKAAPTFKLLPNAGRVVIREDDFKYEGRITIPDTAQRRPTTGIIVAVGNGVGEFLQIGQRVVYGQFSGTLIQFKAQPAFRILSEDEVLAVIDQTVDVEDTVA